MHGSARSAVRHRHPLTMLRVLIDGWELTSFGRWSGLGSFIRNLSRELAARPDLDVSVLVCERDAVPPGAAATLCRRRWRQGRKGIYEHELRASIDVRRSGADVVYSPNLMGLWSPGRPYVQTLHDVIPLVRDEPDLDQLKNHWRRWRHVYRRADAVVAVSRYSADEGIRLLGLDPARVHVAPNGVDPSFTPEGAPPAGSGSDGDPYILVVSAYSRRKGFDEAFRAIAALADAGYPHRLVIGGAVLPHHTQEFEALVAAAPRPDLIDARGFVDDLPALYRGAAVFWCPSRYEGFGLPVLEAMACGTPVVSYDNSSLPEVAGEAGVLVPDGDVEALVAATRKVLDNPGLAADLRESGLRQAARFTWGATAALYDEVFHQVARR